MVDLRTLIRGFRTPASGADGSSRTDEAGVRKPPKEETAFWKGAGAVARVYGDLGIDVYGPRRLEAKID